MSDAAGSVTHVAGGLPIGWRLPLTEFWREQRRFRALVQLAIAANSAPEQLPARLRDAIADVAEIPQAFSDDPVCDDPDVARTSGLGHIDKYNWSTMSRLMRHALTVRVGELVSRLLTERMPKAKVEFEPDSGFRNAPQFAGVIDMLYWLVVQQLPTFRFCQYCGLIYDQNRPDKRTCSQQCAERLGKREWARKNRKNSHSPRHHRKAKSYAQS
jgi:predicted nucleic acid-binding Zn ribbon protein